MRHQRLLLATILLLILLSLITYYHLEHNQHQNPGPYYILIHPDDFINTKIMLTGDIITVDKSNHTLQVQVVNIPEGIITVTTNHSLAQAKPGDVIEMYGTLLSKNQLNADSILIFDQWNNRLIYLRSLLAVPFLLYLFFRAYRYNTKTFRFERRNP